VGRSRGDSCTFALAMSPEPPAPDPSTPSKKKTPAWAIVLIVLAAFAFVGIVFLGVMAAVGVYGARQFIARSKGAEAHFSAGTLALGVSTRCVEADGKLPPTSPAVPATLAPIRGTKYASTTADWAAPAFTCAGFSLSAPQYFRYQWIQLSPTTGEVVAEGDLDGDGRVDSSVKIPITCSTTSTGLTCVRGTPTIVEP
jgi:hypothetical protein